MAIDPDPSWPQSVFNTQSRKIARFVCGKKAYEHLHKHQIDALRAMRSHFANYIDDEELNVALVVLPTGCGKTGVAVLAPYVLNASRVLVITPSTTISKQIHEEFRGERMFLLQREIISAEHILRFRPPGSFITRSSNIKENLSHPLMVVNAHKIGDDTRVKIADIPNDCYDLVIVDEAHHYPAKTWKHLVDHFPYSRHLFLTATPYHNGKYILDDNPPCFTLSRQEAVARGIIRSVEFFEATSQSHPGMSSNKAIAHLIHQYLNEHDQIDPRFKHQAMVLTQTINSLNPAVEFVKIYNEIFPNDGCEKYTGDSSPSILTRFEQDKIRVLVVVGKLLEGFDRKNVSVAAIVRNVAPSSKVLFAQFVGRAVRKFDSEDNVTAMVVSHEDHKQRVNFEQFDQLPDDDNVDDF